jgi:pyruvate dehydrogenase E2 component (dihydrolipoamide acetyltransferase)
MTTDIVMPNMGFDTQTARLIEWLKQPGDVVVKGEIIAVIESDKANVELESSAAGVVLELLADADEDVAVGAVIARIGEADDLPQPAPAGEPGRTPETKFSPVAKRLASERNVDLARIAGSGAQGRIMRSDVEAFVERETAPANGAGRFRALPKVRKAAREAGIDLTQVTPTGPHGNITLADVKAHQALSAAPAPVPASPSQDTDGREIPLSRVRQIIGQRLGDSKREAPHFYVSGEFDLEAALVRLKSMPAVQVGINDLIQYLTVQTLRRVPSLNATFKDGQLIQYDAINLAIAIARRDGLITPVIHGAERFSLTGLAQESRPLIERARDNHLQPQDLQGGTFTISNLGVVGQVDQFTAIINPPQVAILAVGAVKPRPIVINGGLHVRHTVHLSLSGDHRAVDGMDLGRFMAAFQEELDYFTKG